ncbi:hypothetical protein CANMA_003174 [Candida margitis]|uniref:uncharacterized protein n=1 Tax=Candida margitis TaxID=1775924 RepID=UPI00222772D8|nr:uncharacterized protein CANMA_003174 [Candida margitis]KAI5967354.1 hypothetical protein CANMA_003174 [Candida margitis]
MLYFKLLLLFAISVFADFDLFKRDHDDCNVANIEACREANKMKYVNCEIYDNDSDYESDSEEEYYAEKQKDRCVCNLQDEYYTKVSECAKQCGNSYELKPEFLKSKACSQASSIKPRFAAYVSSRDQTGTPAWSVTAITSAVPSTEAMSLKFSKAEASIKPLADSNSMSARSEGSSSSSAATASSMEGSSTAKAGITEPATTSTQSSSNFAVTVGCGSLILLILLSLL